MTKLEMFLFLVACFVLIRELFPAKKQTASCHCIGCKNFQSVIPPAMKPDPKEH